MRVTEMRTSRSHIVRKNKPVLLGWTALRLCLNNLVSVVFIKKKKKLHQNSYLQMSRTHYTCSCPLISKVTSREGIIGLYRVFIANLMLLQTLNYLTLTMVAKFIS